MAGRINSRHSGICPRINVRRPCVQFCLSPISELRAMQESLAKSCPQRYNTDNPKQTKRSPSLPDPGKGRRAFLTTEPTTYSPGAHGKPAFKECYRVRESERKRPKISKKHQKKCFSFLRVQEAVGLNLTTYDIWANRTSSVLQDTLPS